VAEIGPTAAPQFTQGRIQGNPAADPAGRVIPFPQVPDRNSAHPETRTPSGMPSTPGKTTRVAPTGGVGRGFAGGPIIQLVAEQQLSGDGSGAGPNRLVLLRAVAAYQMASVVGVPPPAADGGEAVSKPGATFDFLT